MYRETNKHGGSDTYTKQTGSQTLKRDKEGCCIMIEVSLQEEHKIIENIYIPQTTRLIAAKGRTHSPEAVGGGWGDSG
jgi:hypothetical protein